MSMLLELYGTPAPIATQYPTRQHPDCVHPRKQVQCRCGEWQDLVHNSYCTGCAIWLVELPTAPATVATPEPVAVEEAAQVQTVEQVAADIEHYKSVCQMWDDEFDEPYTAPNEEMSAETLELIAANDTPLNLDEPLALEVRPSWMQPEATENATEAALRPKCDDCPGMAHPMCCTNTLNRPEQKEYFVKFVLNSDQSKKYAMLFRKSDGLAVGCECKSRKFHHGVACKHMRNHNAMLAKPAKKQQQVAA